MYIDTCLLSHELHVQLTFEMTIAKGENCRCQSFVPEKQGLDPEAVLQLRHLATVTLSELHRPSPAQIISSGRICTKSTRISTGWKTQWQVAGCHLLAIWLWGFEYLSTFLKTKTTPILLREKNYLGPRKKRRTSLMDEEEVDPSDVHADLNDVLPGELLLPEDTSGVVSVEFFITHGLSWKSFSFSCTKSINIPLLLTCPCQTLWKLLSLVELIANRRPWRPWSFQEWMTLMLCLRPISPGCWLHLASGVAKSKLWSISFSRLKKPQTWKRFSSEFSSNMKGHSLTQFGSES